MKRPGNFSRTGNSSKEGLLPSFPLHPEKLSVADITIDHHHVITVILALVESRQEVDYLSDGDVTLVPAGWIAGTGLSFNSFLSVGMTAFTQRSAPAGLG